MKKNSIFKPLSNIDILNYGKNKNIKIFCVAKDQLRKKKKLKNNESIVINLDDMENEGTHWVCLICKNNKLFYYDPFGVIYLSNDIANYIKKHKTDFYSTTEQNQSITSNKCGWFCLAIINCVLGKPNMSFQRYMDLLTNVPNEYNEYIIFSLI